MTTTKNRHTVHSTTGPDTGTGKNRSLLRDESHGHNNNALKNLVRASALAAFLALPKPALAGNVTLAWDISKDPTVVGYNIYYGGSSGNYTNMVNVGNTNSVTISGLSDQATYYFAGVTYNASDVLSPFSNEVNYTVPGVLLIVPGSNPNDPVYTDSLPKQNTLYTSANAATGEMQISYQIGAGHYAVFQATTSLVNPTWKTVWTTPTATASAVVRYADPQSTVLPFRFYRVLMY